MSSYRTLPVSFLLALLTFGCSPAERGESGEIESAGAVDAFTLQVGDCYNDRAFQTDEVSDVPGVPCSEPHDNEVYATFDLEGSAWPGDDRVPQLAEDGCLSRFAGAIGATYEKSVLMFTTIYPTQSSWTRVKDREVICAAYDMNLKKRTGSMMGGGR